MALMKSSNVPKDAVKLNEAEAITYVWEIVSNWNPSSDTRALRYGSTIVGVVNAISGAIINNHYRQKLKLGPYGFYASVIPVTVMPGILTTLFHRHLIPTDMLLMKKASCPICYELRSALIQISLGVAYPMVLAPNAALMLANRYNTARIPHLNKGAKVMFNFLGKLTKPFSGTLMFIAAVQLVTSSVVTYFELNNHLVLKRKITEIEKTLLLQESNQRIE